MRSIFGAGLQARRRYTAQVRLAPGGPSRSILSALSDDLPRRPAHYLVESASSDNNDPIWLPHIRSNREISDVSTETLAIVAATLLGPILAVQIQKYLERRRALRERRNAVFRTLMTRRFALTIENVQAFNAVPVEFYGVSTVIDAWRAYLKHLSTPSDSATGGSTASGTPAANVWGARRVDLFFDLLQKMAVDVGYNFDFVRLKEEYYSPQLHADVETDQETIRRGLAGLLSGKTPLPLDVQHFPADPELNGLLKDWLKGLLGRKG